MKIIAGLRAGKSCPEVLFSAFVETDKDFLKEQSSSAGTTANILLWDMDKGIAYIGNSGDTRAVLSRDRKAIDLTEDKKASDPREIARIVKEGGFVVNNRVMGSLAVARALGDSHLKDADSDGIAKRVLISDPEVTVYVPQVTDDFIIIASDGLWDVLSSQVTLVFY